MFASDKSGRGHLSVIPLVAFGVLALGLVSCSDESRQPTAAPQAASSTSAAGSAAKEDGCARVISAIGWTEFMLVEPGRESEQDFESGVRGRLSYVDGTVKIFGEYLPSQAVAPSRELQRQVRRIVSVNATQAEKVDGLKDYRRAVAAVERACGQNAQG